MNETSCKIEASEHITNAYMEYAVSTIVDRALPDVRDGLKPVHRRILYAMHKNKIDYSKKRAKSADAVGGIMNYHYHGDASIYDALAILTEQNGTLLHPYIDGEGSFGKVYSVDKPSASRYTYCRLNKFTDEMFCDLNKGIVKFIGEDENYLQPIVLTNTYPNILIKPNEGIAVGEACNFPSFNLREVCEFTKAYIKDSSVNVADYIKAPDFSSKAEIIYNEKEIEKILDTGKGSIVLRGKVRYVKEENMLEIYEIPYNTTVDTIISKIENIIATGQCKDILDVRNEQGFDEELGQEVMLITVDLKRNADVDKTIAFLYKKTPLQTTMSVNMNCLVDNQPMVLGIKAIIDEWLKFRHECIIKSNQYDLTRRERSLHLNLGLQKVLLDLDEAVRIVKNTSSDEETLAMLMDRFEIDSEQAEYVSNIKLRNFNKNFFLNKTNQIDELKNEIEKINNLIKNKELINDVVISQLDHVQNNYSKDRLTKIVYDEVEKISNDIFIEDYNCTVVVTDTYIKKNLRYLENQKVKDGESVKWVYPCKNTDTVMVFTDKNNMYTVSVHELQETQPSALGQYMPSLLGLDNDESILFTLVVNESSKGNLVFFYGDSGKCAKVPLENYRANRKKLTSVFSKSEVPMFIYYDKNDGDEVFYLLKSSIDKVLIINNNDLGTVNSRTANGVYTIRAKNDSYLETVKILTQEDIIENVNLCYYFGKPNSIGKYLKQEDKGIL